jgi:hypothetical protein
MDLTSLKQVVKGIPTETIVADSCVVFEIEKYNNLRVGETIETSKIEFLEIDACW